MAIARLLVASALTPLHPGAGRAPGAVDLPVVRDTLGYPYIRGSMVKGALKTLLARKLNCSFTSGGKGPNRVDCNKCCTLCCLLGGEVGEGDRGASAVSIQDLYPLFIPAPAYILPEKAEETREGEGEGVEKTGACSGIDSSISGIVYVTTESLLARAQALAEAAGNEKLAEALAQLAVPGDCQSILYTSSRGKDRVRIVVAGQLVEACLPKEEKKIDLDDLLALKDLNPLYKRYPLQGRIIVFRDNPGQMMVERLLQRVTRVALDRITKTVAEGHLWTEEYLPWGTLLAGLLVDTGFRNQYCNGNSSSPLDDLASMIRDKLGDTLVVGGKESVGGGLVKLKTLGDGKP